MGNFKSFTNLTLLSVYLGVTENVLPDQAYLDKNTPIIQGRIVLGGYRLYALMRYIFTPGVEFPSDLFLN